MSEPVQDLPQGYYLANFLTVTRSVVERYGDLLNSQEQQFYQAFQGLQLPAQYLYVRLLMRKGSLFRASKLRYAEIPSLAAASQELQENALLGIDPPLPMSAWLPLFNKAECLAWLAQQGVDEATIKGLQASKRGVLDAFAAAHFAASAIVPGDSVPGHGPPTGTALTDIDQPGSVPSGPGPSDIIPPGIAPTDTAAARLAAAAGSAGQALPAAPETCYQLLEPDMFEVFKLLYFGNPRQDLTDFILRDLAITRFESYSLERSVRLFDSRQQIDQQLAFHRLSAALETILQGDAATILAFHRQLPAVSAADPRLQRQWQRVTLQLARQLERLQCPQEALQLYRTCQLAPSRERQARLLAGSGELGSALALCGEIASDPQSDEELEFAHSFGHRTAKKLPPAAVLDLEPAAAAELKPAAALWPAPGSYQPAQRNLLLQRPVGAEAGTRVELLAAGWYASDGRCYYVENALFLSLFALIFWEVIYAPVAGGFSHPFQYRPHDLYEPDFLRRRQSWYDRARQCFAADNCPAGLLHSQPLLARYAAKQGLASNLVFWPAISPELLQLTLQRVPAADLEKICARLWQDLKNNRNGLPDLIHFPATGGYRLVEVKAPGDRLQKNQRRWMAWFERFGIPHEVAQVDWH